MPQGKASCGEGALAGGLTVSKSVRFIEQFKQRRLITALCCNVSRLSWQVTPHVGWSGRRTQLLRYFESYGTEAQYPRRTTWLSAYLDIPLTGCPRHLAPLLAYPPVLRSRDSLSPIMWSKVRDYQAGLSSLVTHSLDRFPEWCL